ncbi:MAG: hypothetical protein U0S36_09015 [Candidatus Nanopelagicales bacterium]
MPRTARHVSRRTAAVLAAALIAVVPLAGCGVGFTAGTQQQRPSGNGANADLGALQLRGVTLVAGPDGSKTGTITMTVVNTGDVADALTGVRMVKPPEGTATILGTATSGGALPLPRASRTLIGYNSDIHVDITDVGLTPTQFTEIEFAFQRAGRITLPVMSVLPTGIYEGITPLPVPSLLPAG